MSQSAAVLPPPGPAARALHVELPSQQRRLRHLRNIAARNIINRNGFRLLDTYFTLHLCDNTKICKEFYRSEVIKNSLNPTWRSLDFGLMPDRLDTSVSCFVVRIWGGENDAYQLLIEWNVNLDGLKYLGQQIHARSPNEIIFGLNDGYYGASYEQKGHSGTQKNNLLQVDQNCVRNSYDVFSLLRGTPNPPSQTAVATGGPRHFGCLVRRMRAFPAIPALKPPYFLSILLVGLIRLAKLPSLS